MRVAAGVAEEFLAVKAMDSCCRVRFVTFATLDICGCLVLLKMKDDEYN